MQRPARLGPPALGAVLALSLASAAGIARASPAANAAPLRIERYRVEIEPDLEARSIRGATTLSVRLAPGARAELRFPLEALTIDAVAADGVPLAFAHDGGVLALSLPPGPERRDVTVRYHGSPQRGLVWGDRSVRTAFFSCAWMVCDPDRPGDRAPLALDVIAPEGLRVVASGREIGARPAPGGKTRHAWRQDRPYPTYLFAFAVGTFERVTLASAPPGLDAVGERVAPARLARLFAETGRMRAFFEARAGVALPGRYTQVLVEGEEAQEASSLSFVGRAYVEPILDDPREDWAIAHELAHQWWGNLVTCASWRHFWLNEGLTVFMVAAWKERRWGRADYDREMALARARHQKAIDAGFDAPLAYGGAYPSLAMKRAIAYSKGALFLDALRRRLGERAFWAGIRRYTRAFAGRAVESRDLQRALEAASGVDLSEPFATWVYGR
jgi:aminopeptidase N